MTTRTGTTTSDAPEVDPTALDAAMKTHPVVVAAIARVGNRARDAEAARDTAVKDLAAERREHRKTAAALEVTKGALASYTKAFGAPPVAATPSPAVEMSDAEALAKFDAMSPDEKALLMAKAAQRRRFDVRGPAVSESIFAA